eukprot:jgi/Orpsp1_1/1184754/evm.model.c7180000090867.1
MISFYYKLLLLCIYTIFIIHVDTYYVTNEKEFFEQIDEEKTLSFSKNVEISSYKTIVIKSDSELIFEGNSMNKSHLHFLHDDIINLEFQCTKIIFQRLSITGNIKFSCNTVIFDYAILNGYFISDYTMSNNDNSTISVELYNSFFNLNNQQQGLEIHNSNLILQNSSFYGNNHYNLYLLKYLNEGSNLKNIFNADKCHFEGNYHNNGILCTNSTVNIYNSKFYYFHGTKDMEGGGAITVKYTKNSFSNIEFLNNYSEYYGGSILFYYSLGTIASLLHFKNSTSSYSGNSFSFYSDDKNNAYTALFNITQTGIYDSKSKINTEGSFFSAYGKNYINFDIFYGNTIGTGSPIFLSGDTQLVLRNFNIENIYSKTNGAIFQVTNPNIKGANIQITKSQFKNINQVNEFYSATLVYMNGGIIKIDECKFYNINGMKSSLTYQENDGVIEFRDTDIVGFYSKYPEPIFYANFNNEEINDVSVLFLLSKIALEITNTNFYNIHLCFNDNSCNSSKEELSNNFESAFFYMEQESHFYMKKCNFDNIYGRKGIVATQGKFYMDYCSITNSYFENGFIYYPNIENVNVEYIINLLTFTNNTSNRGTFMYISDIIESNASTLLFKNMKFINNTATNFGGVIYSEARKHEGINKIFFSNCSFKNNTASHGNISYIYDNDHDVSYRFSNEDVYNSLKEDENNFVTNPTHLIFNNYNNEVISVYSGDLIEDEYS